MSQLLDFETPIAELEARISEFKRLATTSDLSLAQEINRLEKKLQAELQNIYKDITPWQSVLVARHPQRPHTKDYVEALLEDFTPLSGDRLFAEDAAILAGIGFFREQAVAVIGHEKGHDTETRIHHNFGMARPEGYRKAQRVMDLAARFHLPLVCFIDTPGAHPGPDAEERGQSEALASCLLEGISLKTPVISVVIGEGGSGGAVALGVADWIMMLQYAVYSVISPEGCASILWRTRDKRAEAAAAQKLTASDLLKLGLVDQVIKEPLGGAHRDVEGMCHMLAESLEQNLRRLCAQDSTFLMHQRRKKFLQMGRLNTQEAF